jgi:hypothetical protein
MFGKEAQVARARVELLEGLSCGVRGHTFKKGSPVYIDDAALIAYLKNQSNFQVVVLTEPVKVLPLPVKPPVPPLEAKKIEPTVPLGMKVVVEEPKTPEVSEAKPKEEPEPLERTPVKPVPRPARVGRGRRSLG